MNLFTNILLVLAGAKGPAFEKAADLAGKNKARLRVIDVIDEGISANMLPTLLTERAAELRELVSGLAKYGINTGADVITGTPFIEIIKAATSDGHDLVIKDAEGRPGLKERLFGSTDMHLLRKCPCPVWINRPAASSRVTRILAPVDPDPFNDERDRLNHRILGYAAAIAREEGARLYIVNAWSLMSENLLRMRSSLSSRDVDALEREAHAQHRERLRRLLEDCDLKGVDHEVHQIKGDAGDVIPDLARKVRSGLIVMGTVARTGVPGLFIGNTAEAILGKVNSSVLALKPEGFETPVSAA